MRYQRLFLLLLLSGFAFPASLVHAQSKGKISGNVIDDFGAPLPGVQVVIEGTQRGTVTAADGFYQIVSVDPGTYALNFRFIGFADLTVTGVQVVPDQTTTIDATMREEVVQGEEVVVVAQRPIVQKDRTTTTAYVDEEQIEALPVTSLSEIINLQAGVVDGHFRGGRTNEVSYVVNGVPINNPYTNTAGFEIEQNMVSSLEVITGVFNAEYGQATSGVVNIETKGAPSKWSGSALVFARALASGRKMDFLDRTAPAGSALAYSDFETKSYSFMDLAGGPTRTEANVSLGGPLYRNRLGINVNARYIDDQGYFFGRDLFKPGDYSAFIINRPPRGYADPENPQADYIIESTGSGDFVSMASSKRLSLNTAVALDVSSRLKLDYNLFLQDNEWLGFSHARKYAPDGRNKNYSNNMTHIAGLRYVATPTTFVDISYAYQQDDYESYLYQDPLDARLVPGTFDSQTGQYAFMIGGNERYQAANTTSSHSIVASVSSQLNRIHQVKTGVQARFYSLDNDAFPIEHTVSDIDAVTSRPLAWVTSIPAVGDWRRNTLNVSPREFSAYIQDKIELQHLIINAGLRFDRFDARYDVPLNWSNPEPLYLPSLDVVGDSVYNRTPAKAKYQLSPRIGVAFPISANGVIRFSYGMFFQVPNYQDIFSNPNYIINRASSTTGLGNPDIEPQSTSTFEVGLQQGLTDALGVELTLYSRDVRELLYNEIEQTTTGDFIVRSVNKNYGTVRGFTLAFFQRQAGPLAWTLDYTLQFADGSFALSGDQFLRVRRGLDETYSLARLTWDRRHVANATITLSPNKDLRATLINRFQTGQPYTSVRSSVMSNIPNNVDSPAYFTSDLRVYYKPFFIPFDGAQLFLQVDNIFDTQVQQAVYADSGTATETPTMERVRDTPIQGLNTIDEYFWQQGFFGSPRQIALGLNFRF